MAVPKRKTSPSRRGMRRSADALKKPTYVEDKDSGELRRPHHIDLKTGMYRGRQVLKVKRSEEHTSELQSRREIVCRLLLEKKKKTNKKRGGVLRCKMQRCPAGDARRAWLQLTETLTQGERGMGRAGS